MSRPYPSFSTTLFPLHPEEVNFQFRPDHLAFTPFSAFSLLSTQSMTPSRTIPASIQTSTDPNNNNVHYSNKRKEFEARSEKKVQTDKFCCPICGFNGLNDLSSLRHHFQDELTLFLQTDSSYGKIREKHPTNQELHIDVESITTDADEMVTSSSCSPSSPSVSSFSTGIYNSKFPSEYNRSKGERWERFREIRSKRSHRSLSFQTWSRCTSSSTPVSCSSNSSSSLSIMMMNGMKKQGSPSI